MKNLNSRFLIRNSARTRAFTLIELLVVITIIGILITLVMVAVVPVQRKSRDARRKADINSFLSAANLFKADFKIYPNTTFNLGSQTDGANSDGDANSNFAISGDVFACNSAPLGKTSNFTNGGVPAGSPTVPQMDNTTGAPKVTMTPGFASVNNFLICLKYTNTLLTDPKPTGNNQDKYQYRVSYDYVDIVVAATLENANDSDNSYLFNSTTPAQKRYNRGSGIVVRHLDDDSDSKSGNASDVNYGFFNVFTSAPINDGKYLYQCKRQSAGAQPAIKPDDRVAYEPIVNGTSSYGKNTACKDDLGDLDVIQAY